MNFFRGRVVRCETSALCTIQLQSNGNGKPGIELSAALEEHTQPDKVPGAGDEAYVLVDPRSITLYQTLPDSSARNVFHGEIVQLVQLGINSGKGSEHDGRVRVSITVDDAAPPLTAEVTETSVIRMGLSEGKRVYATFKATEARAYI